MFLKAYKEQLLILFAILILAIFSFNNYQHQINPDGIAYISIAKFYLNGNFDIAINGYWSPLFSILLIPFLLLRIPDIVATKILSVILCFLIVLMIRRILIILKVSKLLLFIVCIASCPLFLFYGFSVITPDLLVVLVMLCYLKSIIIFFSKPTLSSAKWVGLFGGIGYLAKSYIFPFFFLNLLVIGILFYVKFRKDLNNKQMLKLLAAVITSMLIICVPWILLISTKYNILTISTSGAYNWGLINPQNMGIHYMQYTNFVMPVDSRFPNAWVDPSYMNMPQWNPLGNVENFRYFLSRIFLNLYSLYKYIKIFPILIPLIGVLIYEFLCNYKKRITSFFVSSLNIKIILLTSILFPLGYFLVLIEERYVWFLFASMIIGFALLYEKILIRFPNGGRRILIYLILIIIMSYFANNNIQTLLGQNKNDEVFNISKIIAKEVDLKDKIIANQSDDLNWFMHLSYFLDGEYYGQYYTDNVSASVFYADLKEKNINYYFVHGEPKFDMSKFTLVFSSEETFLKLYKIDNL